jgi:hypothetical protein
VSKLLNVFFFLEAFFSLTVLQRSTRVRVRNIGVGISILNNIPQEILHVTLYKIDFDFKRSARKNLDIFNLKVK